MKTIINYMLTTLVFMFVGLVIIMAGIVVWNMPPTMEGTILPIHYVVVVGALVIAAIGMLVGKGYFH